MKGDLRIEMRLEDQCWQLILSGGQQANSRQIIRATPPPGRKSMQRHLAECRGRFRKQMEDLMDAHHRRVPDKLNARETALHARRVLARLSRIGWQSLRTLMKELPLSHLREWLRAAHPAWTDYSWVEAQRPPKRPWEIDFAKDTPPPRLVLVADDDAFFPLDLLPLLDSSPIGEKQESLAASELAMRFPCLSFVTQRAFRSPLPQHRVLANADHLRVRLYQHQELHHTHRELGFMEQFRAIESSRSRSSHSDPIPSGGTDDWTGRVAGDLQDDRLHAVHFACHFGASEDSTAKEGSSLLLQFEEWGPEIGVPVKRLRARMASCLRGGHTRQLRPLVFLNACGSANHASSERDSFAKLLWENGNAAFIGTETNVHDASATDMAKLFYHYLHAGFPAPRALHLARLRMIKERSDPIGLLYSYYGPGDLRVEARRDWFYPSVQP